VGWFGVLVAFAPIAFARAEDALFGDDQAAFNRWDSHFGQVFFTSIALAVICCIAAVWARKGLIGFMSVLAPLIDLMLLFSQPGSGA
jgi:hypothetical protein